MNSCELMKAAINKGKPERLPLSFGIFQADDRAWVPVGRAEGFEPEAEGEDEWGCIWDHTDMKNMGQVKGHPFENGIPDDLSVTRFPDYDDDSRYTNSLEAIEKAEARGKYINVGLFMVLFERMHSMMGFENAFIGLADPDMKDAMGRFADHIVDVHLKFVKNLSERFGTRIHSISMTDDFGTQQAAYVSADHWMEFFYPRYRKLFDAMHEAGYDVWVHSCGKVNEIVECYIKAGVDVVNLQQPRTLGIEEMGERYRGRITFESLADIQNTLPKGDKKLIEEDVELLMNHWASPEGGFILSDYGDGEAIGAPVWAKEYMYREFSKWSEKIYGNPLPEPVIPAE